ncbi:GerMN domain-containing protein [Hamadaea tsunoensis]|uniref:GerMN domain-containing protein n=1 Tax=Hamadaea tsunoensis TaxID=53368 RepID=UPI000404F3B2|nr:GerMN domain-containing protein [Hamadaea tsunoensis]
MTGDTTGSRLPDPTESRLRAALEARAATVDVAPDALSAIRARTRRRGWWHRIRGGVMPLTFTFGAASAAAATVTAVVLSAGSCAPRPVATPSGQPPAASAESSASPAASPPESPPNPSGGSTSGGSAASVPVYYIGSIGGVPKLYREFHAPPQAQSVTDRVGFAVRTMLDGRTAYDHDYISSWPASTRLRSVTVAGDTTTVDLSGAAVNAYDPPTEKAALQQLIWTVTAASGGSGVRLLLDGKPVGKLWNLLPVQGTLRRAAAVDTLAPVWVIDPQQGATYPAGPVTINVAGIVFEATMRVRVRDSAGKIVFDKSVHLSAGPPTQGTAVVRTGALTAGTYTVEGFYISAKDSSIQAMDNHTFTVR